MYKDIALKIVERYEKSAKFRDKSVEGNMSVNFQTIKEYNSDSNYKYRFAINEAAVAMEKRGLILIKWISKDNIIERISFNLKDMDKFYDICGSQKKEDVINDVLDQLGHFAEIIYSVEIKNMLNDFIAQINKKQSVPKVIEDDEKRQNILDILLGIDEIIKSDESLYERVFSKKYIKNSKTFEKKYRTTTISLLKKYFEGFMDLDDDEVLSSVGIIKTNNDLNIKGSIIFKLEDSELDLSGFLYGVGLNDRTISEISLKSFSFDRVISVENKANFNYLCQHEKDALIIFSGGFYSPSHRRFLLRLYNDIKKIDKNVEFYHWGDIDFGGINIYRHIKNNIIKDLKPLLMDVKTIEKNIDYCEKIDSDDYIKKLSRLLDDKSIAEMHGVIQYIIKKRITLEQECIIIKY